MGAGTGADGFADVADHSARVSPPAGEVHPVVRAQHPRDRRIQPDRRPPRSRRRDRPADAGTAWADDKGAAAGHEQRRRPSASAAANSRAAHTVEQADHTAPALRLHHHSARRCQARPSPVRVHVQRCGHGSVLGRPATISHPPRLPTGGTADRDGADQRAQRHGNQYISEQGFDAARRPRHQRGRSRRPPAPCL